MPFVELLAHSADLATREQADPLHMDARFLLGYALPEYWGRPSGFQIAGFLVARAFYVGALPLMLAVWAVVTRPTRERVAVAAAAAVALAVVIGLPGVFDLVTALPGFASAYNTRLPWSRPWRWRCSRAGGSTTSPSGSSARACSSAARSSCWRCRSCWSSRACRSSTWARRSRSRGRRPRRPSRRPE